MSRQDPGEILWEAACSEYSEELADERERLLQCIYVFVEGPSEVEALSVLLPRAGVDLEEQSIELVDMGGASNAKHAVRVLRRTASKNRPILLVLDADQSGVQAARSREIAEDPLTIVAYLPEDPFGGELNGTGLEFEDSFPHSWVIQCFLAQLPGGWKTQVDPDELLRQLEAGKPVMRQIQAMLHRMIPGFSSPSKPELAARLAEIQDVPEPIIALAKIILNARSANPVETHNDKVFREMGG